MDYLDYEMIKNYIQTLEYPQGANDELRKKNFLLTGSPIRDEYSVISSICLSRTTILFSGIDNILRIISLSSKLCTLFITYKYLGATGFITARFLNFKIKHRHRYSRKEKEIRYNRDVYEMEFQIGDRVLRLIEHSQTKLEPKWEGPYTIKTVLEKGTYIIKDDFENRDLVHGDRLKNFREDSEENIEVENVLRSNIYRFRREEKDL
ncbi:hypothetical protein BB560_002160 [Smittium megazygosporum]|uniref:Integrase zinc-binding domain-containing protein n=1 Tax=Smittium megazygosporum TaxID=133381 RepID=A0A2T9ZFH0_9FUNG|nr:hypothetical protein BB560_002160 [Smittium megazygosporum]